MATGGRAREGRGAGAGSGSGRRGRSRGGAGAPPRGRPSATGPPPPRSPASPRPIRSVPPRTLDSMGGGTCPGTPCHPDASAARTPPGAGGPGQLPRPRPGPPPPFPPAERTHLAAEGRVRAGGREKEGRPTRCGDGGVCKGDGEAQRELSQDPPELFNQTAWLVSPMRALVVGNPYGVSGRGGRGGRRRRRGRGRCGSSGRRPRPRRLGAGRDPPSRVRALAPAPRRRTAVRSGAPPTGSPLADPYVCK